MTRAVSRSRPRDVAELIAWDIQSGVLTPGMWLKQIDLEMRYKRSRGDVRRALDRLVEKRLVQHIPNRGYHVYAPDGRQAAELRDIRVILETAAVDGIIASASPPAIERIRRLAQRFADLIPTGTVLEQYEANIAFHVELLALCPNRELGNLVMELRRRNSAAPASQWKTRAQIERIKPRASRHGRSARRTRCGPPQADHCVAHPAAGSAVRDRRKGPGFQRC